MNIERMNDNERADMAANIVELLSGTELGSIDANVRAAFIAAIGTKPQELAAQTAAATALDGEKQAAFSIRDRTSAEVAEWARQLRATLRALRAPKSEFDLCGLDYPGRRSGPYIAKDPSNLSGVGFSNGVNRLRFFGNNSPGLVFFDIWRREGDGGTWHPHAFSKKQKFDDVGLTPGQHYEYRVRAAAAQTVSNFSNSAVVYGVL